jgi:archaellum component FlaD/FlaE
MELDKRVNEIETELKIMKGEIKELLVDIRDLVNKSENPFCSVPSLEALKIGIPEKEESVDNQPTEVSNEETGLSPITEVSEFDNQIVKNSESFLKSTRSSQENPVQNIPRKEMNRPEPESLRKIDTFMLVELMRWVDYAVRTIGHSNLKELLNLYTLTGQLPEETRRIIENIANLSIEEPAEEERVSMKDNIMVLSQLSAIMNPEGFRKNIQPLYETSPGWKDKEKEKKAGLVSIEFEARKELRD